MTPGSNLLNAALRVIAKQTITYYRQLDRTLNNVGQNIAEYAPAITIVGSFQPVPQRLYEAYGLDLQKSYYTFYTSNNVMDVQRKVSGDQITFQGKRFQCESNNDWYGLDGWKGVLCVMIGDDSESHPDFGFNETPEINENLNFVNGNFVADGGT